MLSIYFSNLQRIQGLFKIKIYIPCPKRVDEVYNGGGGGEERIRGGEREENKTNPITGDAKNFKYHLCRIQFFGVAITE